MSRNIDYDNLEQDDLEYIAQRGFEREMARRNNVEIYHDGDKWQVRDQERGSASEEGADEGYDSWKNADLQAELETRGLSKTGKHDELVARLVEDDEEDEEEEEA